MDLNSQFLSAVEKFTPWHFFITPFSKMAAASRVKIFIWSYFRSKLRDFYDIGVRFMVLRDAELVCDIFKFIGRSRSYGKCQGQGHFGHQSI